MRERIALPDGGDPSQPRRHLRKLVGGDRCQEENKFDPMRATSTQSPASGRILTGLPSRTDVANLFSARASYCLSYCSCALCVTAMWHDAHTLLGWIFQIVSLTCFFSSSDKVFLLANCLAIFACSLPGP